MIPLSRHDRVTNTIFTIQSDISIISVSSLKNTFLNCLKKRVQDLFSSCNTHVQLLSLVRLFETPWTVACVAPLSVGFCRQEYWSGLPFSPPGDLPNPGIEPRSPALLADSLPLSHWESPVRAQISPDLLSGLMGIFFHLDYSFLTKF